MDSNFRFRAISDSGPWSATRSLFKIIQPYLDLPYLDLPGHHDVRASDVDAPRLYGNLAAAADRGPTDFADPLLSPGVGAPTVRALAMVAEVVHGATGYLQVNLSVDGKIGSRLIHALVRRSLRCSDGAISCSNCNRFGASPSPSRRPAPERDISIGEAASGLSRGLTRRRIRPGSAAIRCAGCASRASAWSSFRRRA
jgi:hypothetical protein